jgi:hypothetical protein
MCTAEMAQLIESRKINKIDCPYKLFCVEKIKKMCYPKKYYKTFLHVNNLYILKIQIDKPKRIKKTEKQNKQNNFFLLKSQNYKSA